MAEATDLQRLVRVAETSADAVEDSNADCADLKKCVECLVAMQDVKVTAELLQETGFGPRVRRLRKHAHKDIATAAANVVAAWKQAVTNQMSKDRQPAKSASDTSGAKASAAAAASREPAPGQPAPCEDGKNTGPKKFKQPAPLANQQRHKIRETMGQALLEAVEADDEAIEEAVHKKKSDAEYKTRMRTIIFNLKDKKNPQLRRRVVLEEISPEDFAVMSSEDMASDQKQDEIKKIRAHMQKETKRTNNDTGNITDMFLCGKCKKRRCSYYQMQTRSADEPMTTFVRCLECGHRWKFC